MSRPRTPTHILEMRGAFKKNPARGLARAASADSYFSREQRPPFPPMRAKFGPLSGVETTKSKRLREIWETIEQGTRQVELTRTTSKSCPLSVSCCGSVGMADPAQEECGVRWSVACGFQNGPVIRE